MTILRGENSGTIRSFDGGEVRFGRSESSNVVIKDRGTSRNHARIHVAGGVAYIEDLNTTNGTQVNGARISPEAAVALRDGDELVICDTVMRFGVHDDASDPAVSLSEVTSPQGKPEDSNATRHLSTGELARRRDPLATLPSPLGAGSALAPGSTIETTDPGPLRPEPLPGTTGDSQGSGPKPSGPGGLALPAFLALPAADRARIRRDYERTVAGRVEFAWLTLDLRARVALRSVGAVLSILVLASTAYYGLKGLRPAPPPPEVEVLALNASPVRQTYGYGEGVVYERRDAKQFTFRAASAARMVGVLHYRARDISDGEVAVIVNGAEVGMVPADTSPSEARVAETVIRAEFVRPQQENVVVFDNRRNPPGQDTWQIFDVWLEASPVPDVDDATAGRNAREAIARADVLYERRHIGAENLFLAWKTYREAWLSLESTRERPEDLHQAAFTRMMQLRPELDRQCNSLLVPLRAAYESGSFDAKRVKVLALGITSHFPGREHPCHNISLAIQRDLVEGSVRPFTGAPKSRRQAGGE